MKKQNFLRLALLSSVCVALSCGTMFQPSTNLGRQIVNDADPNILDIKGNIKRFSDTLLCPSFSMVDVGDTIPPGYQWNPAFLTVGRFVGLDSVIEDAIGYLEFRPVGLRNDETIRNNLKTGTIDSVVLQLRRFRINTRFAPNTSDSLQLDVDTCPLMNNSSPEPPLLGRATDSIPFSRSDLSQVKALDTLSVSMDSLRLDTMLSVRLDSAIYVTKVINAVKDSTGPSDTGAFALCLAPNNKNGNVGLGRFMNINGDVTSPKIVVYYHHGGASNTIRDSMALWRDHASYTVLEGTDSSIARKSPLSSWETIRRAVFQIDVSSLSTFMDTAAPGNKKYVVIQKANVSIPVSKSISDMPLDSILVQYKLFDSDSLVTSKNSFLGSGSFFIEDFLDHDTSYAISLASMLQPLVVKHRSKSVKLFLMIPTQNSPIGYGPPFIHIAWNPDSLIIVDAIVTNPW